MPSRLILTLHGHANQHAGLNLAYKYGHKKTKLVCPCASTTYIFQS